MNRPIRILHLEDDPRDAELIRQKLEAQGHSVDITWVTGKEAFESALEREFFDVVLTDYNLPDYNGMSALARVREKQPELPVIMISGGLSEEAAVECLKAGATDYVLKQRPQRLVAALARALQEADERRIGLCVGEVLRALTEASEQCGGEGFHAHLVQRLAEILGLEFAFVCILAGPHGDRVRSLAWWSDGRLAENLDYLLAGTPCGDVVNRRPVVIPEDVQKRYPHDAMLNQLGVSAYAAVPLFDGAGQAIGHVGVMGRHPLVRSGPVESVLQIVAVPVATEIARHRIEKQFEALFRQAPDGMIMIGREGLIRMVNQQTERMFGYRHGELIGQPVERLMPDAARSPHVGFRDQFFGSPVHRDMGNVMTDLNGLRKDGSLFPVAISLGFMDIEDDTKGIAAIRDITLRKQQEDRIARLSRIHVLLSGINSLIVRTRDRQELFEEACRLAADRGGFAFAWIGLPVAGASKVRPVAWKGSDDGYLTEVGEALIGLTEDPGVGGKALREKRMVVVNDIEHDPQVAFRMAALVRGFRSLAVFPLMVSEKPVGIFALYAQVTGFFDVEEIKLLTELAGDISFALDHIEKEERLDYLAYYDALTGLPNRALFLDRCNQLLRAVPVGGKSVALMLLDLERFRYVNETLGRHAGDTLLKHLAQRMNSMRPGMDGIARIGADTFALAVPGILGATDAARKFDDEIAPAISAPIEFEGKEYRLSVKVGIALGPADGASAEPLLQNAEAALARAKRNGERRVFYEQEMNARVGERLIFESKLRVALEKDQFVLHYQPKFDTQTRAITGLEALIRWADPELGLVAPAKFVPLLEETGLILEVGRWAMERALSDYGQWLSDGLTPPRIAVNVSAIQLRQKDFAETVRDVLATCTEACEGDSCGLDLEITESLVMEDIESNIPKLNAIREMGIGIYVDDFGTGYSSLSYIARLPINALKIDRAFVNMMTTSAYDRTIVSIIILLAHSLNISVVAEGVETEEQFSLLGILKCDEIQGYLLSRPVPADKVAAMLQPIRR